MATRTTISLPDDLKARMDEVDQPVNWSAEAAKCFEKLLGEIAARKPKKDMSDIIARLKASKLEGEDESYKLGEKAGRVWAEHVASYHELERADPFIKDKFVEHAFDDARLLALELQGVVIEDTNYDEIMEKSERFWERAVPGGLQAVVSMGDKFPEGFIDGASAVWYEVEDKL
ncbi:MAG: hypothetical protein IPN92_16750 [Chromatiaceae bacterium]|nr:hypothetical protein [Chromatiaceae bacterium]